MKKAFGITGIILSLAATGLLLRTRTVHAQSGCTVAALSGSYGFNLQGNYYFVSQTGQVGRGYLSGSGRLIFDGNGSISGSDTLGDDGTILRGSLSGMYTVNSDCTGSLSFTDSNKYGFTFDTVVVNGGKEVNLVGTTNGDVFTGVAKLQ
jgi:hypothetical protein